MTHHRASLLPAICSQKPVSLLSILSHAESCLESMRGRPHLLINRSIAIDRKLDRVLNLGCLLLFIQ
ncbi:hypothetical protein BDA96_09G179500 [Sorghum bicolor]|uniref:Uncharacterized protein n=1 Tax=Sorghum bicolor TaxID=4558 RepID=A0A921QCH4_SORBI|nr:hypothetical protein BDA96_09G179500 [Sorghum bicolor]